jgi:multidrug transporter EmrE-like cation transporter
MANKPWLAIAGLIVAETGAQYFLQRAVKSSRNAHLVAGSTLYVLVALIYYYLLSTGDPMAVANSVWNAGTEVSIALIGWFFFKQKLGTRQILGIAVTMFGIHMLGA